MNEPIVINGIEIHELDVIACVMLNHEGPLAVLPKKECGLRLVPLYYVDDQDDEWFTKTHNGVWFRSGFFAGQQVFRYRQTRTKTCSFGASKI